MLRNSVSERKVPVQETNFFLWGCTVVAGIPAKRESIHQFLSFLAVLGGFRGLKHFSATVIKRRFV